jgi:hypothetical protein
MSSLPRVLQILRVLLRHRLDTLLAGTRLAPWLKLLRPFVPARGDEADLSRGERLRLALQELGPIFVKFGQLLSTRRDLLPVDIADALAQLQDRVAPFPGEQAEAIVASALEKPIAQLYAHFERTPLTAAAWWSRCCALESSSASRATWPCCAVWPGSRRGSVPTPNSRARRTSSPNSNARCSTNSTCNAKARMRA